MIIQLLSDTSKLPHKATPGSAGFDIYANKPYDLRPDECTLIPCGFKMELFDSYVGLVCPRSGMALKNQVTVLNAPGIIDSDYRGEVGVILMNFGVDIFRIELGQAIAQLVITPIWIGSDFHVGELSPTHRGEGGFGSTG